MTTMRFVGIDPGKSGAVAILNYMGKETAFPFPFIGDELDLALLGEAIQGPPATYVLLEKVHSMPKQGVCSVFTFGQGFGELRGMVKTLRIPFGEVTPQAWKKLILAGMDWKGRKECSIEYVMRKYPQIDLKPGRRRTPHDGMADAICIAEYAMRTYRTTDEDWSN